ATLPTGMTATKRVLAISSLDDAITKGITEALFPAEYYHISDFFAVNPAAKLYVGIFELGVASHDFAEVLKMRDESNGEILQYVIVPNLPFVATQVTALNLQLAKLEDEKAPAVGVICADISAITDLATLPDLRTAGTSNLVSVCIAADLSTEAAEIKYGAAGLIAGAISMASVHENIGWVAKFNMALGAKFDAVALQNSIAVKSLTKAQLDGLDEKGYIYLKKYPGNTGSFFNDSFSAIVPTSDYAYLENNRTMAKAMRRIYHYLLPTFNSPLKMDASTGKLAPATCSYFEVLGSKGLEELEKAGELSGWKVSVDPNQNVLATSEVVIEMKQVPLGVTRILKVKIGFTSKI
ncbi:MAG: DUF2586 family protein, partial [Oscillospiraceae bacterium]|nr:DUF2586 family protein [Oscillospiraceae bacterium]